MAIPWSEVVPKKTVDEVKRGKNITITSRGYFNADRSKFIDRTGGRTRVISIERAIFEERISFKYSYKHIEKFFQEISEKEHGFLNELLKLLPYVSRPEKNRVQSVELVLQYLANNHPIGDNSNSRNVIDPFFVMLLDNLEVSLGQALEQYTQKKGK